MRGACGYLIGAKKVFSLKRRLHKQARVKTAGLRNDRQVKARQRLTNVDTRIRTKILSLASTCCLFAGSRAAKAFDRAVWLLRSCRRHTESRGSMVERAGSAPAAIRSRDQRPQQLAVNTAMPQRTREGSIGKCGAVVQQSQGDMVNPPCQSGCLKV